VLYAAEVASAIGSTIATSSFSGLLTRVEIAYIRMGSARNVALSRGGPSGLSVIS
jgi:hypothetical protein